MTPATLKLPLTFDVEKMRLDVDGFADSDWHPHFNQHYYRGDWSGIALRAAAGDDVGIFPDAFAKGYADTPQLARCSYLADVLGEFDCELETVRLLRLGPGAEILRHRDYLLSIDDGVARVHVPVITNPEVRFYLDDELVTMHPGEAWYLNFNLFHRVENTSTEPRIHLVIDCKVNDWFRSLFQVQ